MRPTLALLLVALTATLSVSNVNAAKIDWPGVKPIVAPEMVWHFAEHANGAWATFGVPESDVLLLAMTCASKKSISITYFDAELVPNARYHVHLKAGGRTIIVSGRTENPLELDDIVTLQTSPINDRKFIRVLMQGQPLAIAIHHHRQHHLPVFSLPAHGTLLDPFFKHCGLRR